MNIFHNNYGMDPYVLSSKCPYSCSLLAFAKRIGATIDPEFLMHCRIADPVFQKRINELKPIPINFETPDYGYLDEETLYLDMPTLDKISFADPREFNGYNDWFDSSTHWPYSFGSTEDLIING